MAGGGREHDGEGGGVQEQDDAQLQEADVVAHDLVCAGPHGRGGCVQTGVLSTRSGALTGARSERGRMRSAVVQTPPHTSVASATWKPLDRGASVIAEAAPTAACARSTAMVPMAKMRAQRAQSLITIHRKYTMSTPMRSARPRCSIVNELTPLKSGVRPPPHSGHE